ncbi:uncharacterized protein LOC110462134 isoform X1 [Mizuhopecten yessoensis]|uniref:uncharacterized protein LOC110462134 isoform X1 n=1 Tax=Mizuhopecten yessoensis TaxID=6573 RepID=UPI000B458A16|nr:uncharacterized protein LOC110462134 isoform X1 [Mizuhopecten yessoensis]
MSLVQVQSRGADRSACKRQHSSRRIDEYTGTGSNVAKDIASTINGGKKRRHNNVLDTDYKATSKSKSECPYKILKYEVSKKDYGRLDYNAEIARRIHSKIPVADLDVPDIIIDDCFTFLVIIPNASKHSELIGEEHVTDITKEWSGTEKKGKRWISLLSRRATPIEITEESAVLFLADKPEEDLKNNSKVCKFLTFSFENEIFAYAERALQYVQDQLAKKREHKQETLSYTRLEIYSLLARKLPDHDTPIKQSVQDCGIRGFCNTIDGFLVLVAEPKRKADKTRIADSIEKSLRKLLKEKPKLVWVNKITMADLTAQGCKLTNTETNHWGTLGCFGKDPGNSLVAITAGHCVEKDQIVQIENNGTSEEFGRCVQSHNSTEFDIAVININDSMEPRCTFKFRNEKDEVCKASVYQGDQIRNWPVHKIGAATQWTKGVVYCGEARVCDDIGIIIVNVNDIVFAEEGDSGAIVFFYDPNDIHNREVKLLSIVSKNVTVEKKGTIPVGLSRKPTLTRSLKDGLDKVPNIIIEYERD